MFWKVEKEIFWEIKVEEYGRQGNITANKISSISVEKKDVLYQGIRIPRKAISTILM